MHTRVDKKFVGKYSNGQWNSTLQLQLLTEITQLLRTLSFDLESELYLFVNH